MNSFFLIKTNFQAIKMQLEPRHKFYSLEATKWHKGVYEITDYIGRKSTGIQN